MALGFMQSLIEMGIRIQFFIQFFIINVPSQQLQGQLQTQHSVGTIIQYNIIQFNSIQFIIYVPSQQLQGQNNNNNNPIQSYTKCGKVT
jgi:hypothetical protein